MNDTYIKILKNSHIINIMSVLSIILNIILLLSYDSQIYIIGASVLSVICVYITLILYKKQFDFPLFFVRDRLSYWGGLMGGIIGLVSYATTYLFVLNSDLAFSEIISLIIMAFCLLLIFTTAFTATIINDIKHTDYVDPNE